MKHADYRALCFALLTRATEEMKKELEHLINATPTSGDRDLYTEMNILLGEIETKLHLVKGDPV